MTPPLASFDGFRSCTLICFLDFFFISGILALFYWVVSCLGWVRDTEQQLTAACNVLFWNQVIETNQFCFAALGPLIS
jgi:hypothetical protein